MHSLMGDHSLPCTALCYVWEQLFTSSGLTLGEVGRNRHHVLVSNWDFLPRLLNHISVMRLQAATAGLVNLYPVMFGKRVYLKST